MSEYSFLDFLVKEETKEGWWLTAEQAKNAAAELAALRAAVSRLEGAVQEAQERLQRVAQQADGYHQQQEEAFDKWLKTKKGGKPAPAVALPVATAEMRAIAAALATALAADGERGTG
jgi:chromosome segregation ATPase